MQCLRGEILGPRMRFLLYPVRKNRQVSSRRVEKRYAHSVLYMYAYSLTLCLAKVYKQREVFVLLFISLMVFGDTSYLMSVTSPYAFLVSITQAPDYADFGGLIGNG